jgi:MinD superfamily P-loop ATPase
MKELVIISGKGGTGKTSLTAAFASLAENNVLCDADVDAADLHLLMNPDVISRSNFQGGGVAFINQDRCIDCELCRDLCRFDAINESYEVNPIDCEGCGVCVDFCPEKAIDFPVKTCGEWFVSDTRYGPMVHARLGVAEENSGKLVTLIRQEAKALAEKKKKNLIITDGPPGTGCPVIASIGGATTLLIITEPTVSGLHDMKRVVQLAYHFKIPGMICVNKFDLNVEQTNAIEKIAQENKLLVLSRIPFDPAFTRSMIEGKNIFEYQKSTELTLTVEKIWNEIIKSQPMN